MIQKLKTIEPVEFTDSIVNMFYEDYSLTKDKDLERLQKFLATFTKDQESVLLQEKNQEIQNSEDYIKKSSSISVNNNTNLIKPN